MTHTPVAQLLRRAIAGLAIAGLLTAAGCGGGSGGTAAAPATTSTTPSQSLKAAALSLQQAMDSASRDIDNVGHTRDSLERLATSLQPAESQTGDVIALLTPQAAQSGPESKLLLAARQQRTFLQFTSDALGNSSRHAALSAVTRAREAGRRASDSYTSIAQQSTDVAGLLPASTTFATGRLRDAIVTATRKKAKPKSKGSGSKGGSSAGSGASSGSSGSVSCGDGLSVNSATSCPFAQNVRNAYNSSGGASSVDVFSPVTGTTYTMFCSGGIPTVCRGGNNAVVYIR
jgi:hypothetical protein